MTLKVKDLEYTSSISLEKWTILVKSPKVISPNKPARFHVFYDGREIELVQNFSLDISANEFPKLTLTVLIPRKAL